MATDQVYDDPNGMPMADGKNIHMDIGRGERECCLLLQLSLRSVRAVA